MLLFSEEFWIIYSLGNTTVVCLVKRIYDFQLKNLLPYV